MAERQRAASCAASDYGLVLRNLCKAYDSKSKALAVDHLYVAVERGQCFGLLGMNGAGKTTTFKMLTTKTDITSGEAYIDGRSVRHDPRHIYKVVGYCPQFDALNAYLTGREQLSFYARVRGIREKDIEPVVDWAIAHMHLRPYANQMTRSYSGGNKRKLSAAIAMLGNPQVVLLDEPSTGMDPKTRRFMWDRIGDLVRDGHTVLLTTHRFVVANLFYQRI